MATTGFVLLALATGTACIFEEGEYDGGGRREQGGEAEQTEVPTSPTTNPTTNPTVTPDAGFDAGGIFDAGFANG